MVYQIYVCQTCNAHNFLDYEYRFSSDIFASVFYGFSDSSLKVCSIFHSYLFVHRSSFTGTYMSCFTCNYFPMEHLSLITICPTEHLSLAPIFPMEHLSLIPILYMSYEASLDFEASKQQRWTWN